jgi:hypothetical protein
MCLLPGYIPAAARTPCDFAWIAHGRHSDGFLDLVSKQELNLGETSGFGDR